MKRFNMINNIVFDAGGPILLLLFFGIPILIIVGIVILIIVVVRLIKRAKERRREAELSEEERRILQAQRIEEKRIKEEKAKVRNRKIALFGSAGAAILVVILLVVLVAIPNFAARKDNIKSARIGEIVYFGIFDGKPIAWQVLDVKDGHALLITKSCVARMPYNDEYQTNITWEDCTLRKYLNDGFLNTFSAAQQENIVKTNVINKDNAEYGTIGGNDTIDKIFLLSIDEKMVLDPRNAKYQGKIEWWWLRSISRDGGPVHTYYYGGIDFNGANPDYAWGVRPALWLNLES
jgi:hypothetical protein